MKKFLSPALTAAALSMLLFASCKKTSNELAGPEELVAPPNGGQTAKNCLITQIVVHDPSYNRTSAIFEYNQKGDPVTITPAIVGTGVPRHEFRYSNNHLLTDYIGAYTNGFFEFWYKYTYDNHKRIIRDTQYVFGQYLDEPTNSIYVRVTDYTYDDQGRIIHTATTQLQPTVLTFSSDFTYDANGNLVGPSGYDDKVNLHRTNPIYQFIDRNYSMNNPVAATSYNSTGLPLNFNYPGFTQSFFLHTIYMDNTTITYECKGDGN
jgi:hypothetical protein